MRADVYTGYRWLNATLLAKLVGHGLSAIMLEDDSLPEDIAFTLQAMQQTALA